jgi:hypothetical protein
VLAEPVGQPDAAPDVVRVLAADDGVGVQRVAVAVEPGDLDTGALEQPEEVVPRVVGGEDVVEVGMCVAGRNPPELSSIPVRPSEPITLMASGSDRSCRIAL